MVVATRNSKIMIRFQFLRNEYLVPVAISRINCTVISTAPTQLFAASHRRAVANSRPEGGGGPGSETFGVEKGWRATDKSDLFVAATRVRGGPRINSRAMKETATRRRKRKQGSGGGDSAA